MKTSLLATTLLLLTAFGAGCQLPSRPTGKTTPTTKPVETTKPARSNGFGKLPSLTEVTQNTAPLGSTMAISSISPTPTAAPSANGSARMMAGEVAATDAAVTRPFPIPPPPQTLGTVSYDLAASIPTWDAEGDVLRTRDTSYPSSQISLLAQATGLPTQALGNDPQATSLSFSWKDREKMTWSYDAVQRMVSFWKQDDRVYANAETQKIPSKIDDVEFLRIAQDFLAAKGFGSIPHAPGVVEKPWGENGSADNIRMPCPVPMMGDAVKGQAAETAVAEPAVITTSIAPGEYYPCWYPQQVTVTFGAIRDGKKIHDIGGWPFTSVSVTIDINSKTVMGGSAWLDRDMDASTYKLIDRETATKRLKSGGRNPIWPWGNGTEITVKITSVDLVWMRYDSWNEKDGNATYYLPALAGKGTVEYEKGNSQPYFTIVPLIADDAFEPVKSPEPMPLDIQTNGGSAGVAPAGTGAVTPSTR